MRVTGAMGIMRTMGTTGIMGILGVMGKRQRGYASEGLCICRKIAIFAKLSGKAV